ncbi:MAG: hypothetical protein C0627_08685 [Sulfurimonas sp.]|nr:MAG: hypothetical protein C0627_08685 [Sulfurimonas sp.]
MEMTFKIKYDSGLVEFDGLDMYYGTHSLSALSEFLMISTHAFIHNEIIVKAPASKGFRLVLKRSKEGSLEQVIQLIIADPDILELVKNLGTNGLYDLLKYMLSSLLGIPFIINNRKAKKRIRELEKGNEDLHHRLENALMAAHMPVKKQGYSIAMSMGNKLLIEFNDETLKYLETEEEAENYEVVDVAVSRFNARTGSGRFITSIDSTSYSFELERELTDREKMLMADNLAEVTRGNFKPLKAVVKQIFSRDGKLKRYKLDSISDVSI